MPVALGSRFMARFTSISIGVTYFISINIDVTYFRRLDLFQKKRAQLNSMPPAAG
jgi:hypothetical protein